MKVFFAHIAAAETAGTDIYPPTPTTARGLRLRIFLSALKNENTSFTKKIKKEKESLPGMPERLNVICLKPLFPIIFTEASLPPTKKTGVNPSKSRQNKDFFNIGRGSVKFEDGFLI